MQTSDLLPSLLAIPAAAALLCLLLPSARAVFAAVGCAVAVTIGIAIAVAISAASEGRIHAGGLLFADALSAFHLLVLSAVFAMSSLYAPLYFRETRRRNIEDINVTQQLPDGTEDHQWPGYNFLLLINAGALRLMDARQSLPPWAQPAWERELQTIGWQRELSESLLRAPG